MTDSIPVTPDTEDPARRIMWFEEPAEALADPIRFAAYAFKYATHRDMNVLRRYVTDDGLREALKDAPPGIIDARSWNYWHLKLGFASVLPMPIRNFD